MRRLGIVTLATLGVVALSAGSAAAARVGPVVRASGHSPYPAGCENPADDGTAHRGGEVEPFVAADPRNPLHLISVWQQDRWNNGGANGLHGRVSFDGGLSWRAMRPPPFSFCAGGTVANGGGYARASDPWVTFSPNGTAYFMALAVDFQVGVTAMTVARSTDGGLTWGPVTTLIRNSQDEFFNDKNSMTADPTDSRFAYAVWDRLDLVNDRGPTMFSRTTDGGRSWEPARVAFDPGEGFQTIGNQIQVLPDGTLVNLMTVVDNSGGCADPDLCGGDPDAAPRRPAAARIRAADEVSPLRIAVIRSTDHGTTWSAPVFVADNEAVGTSDPRDDTFVRNGAGLIEGIATDPRRGHRDVYVTWQDSRFTGGARDGIVLAASHDGGRTWSAPRPVSPTAGQAFTPQVTVNPFGAVGISYYDLTNDTVADTALDTDFWVTASYDGGRTFAPRQRVTPRSFDLRQAALTASPFVGDYTGLVSIGPLFAPVFGIANDGSDPDNLTDIVSARVFVPPFPG